MSNNATVIPVAVPARVSSRKEALHTSTEAMYGDDELARALGLSEEDAGWMTARGNAAKAARGKSVRPLQPDLKRHVLRDAWHFVRGLLTGRGKAGDQRVRKGGSPGLASIFRIK